MKVQSNTRPNPLTIKNTDKAILIFVENITEEKIDDGLLYCYDEYRLTVPNAVNLEKRVTDNFDAWLEKAKQVETDLLAAQARDKRNKMLEETDFYFLSDRELDSAKRSALEAYRQALRDLTKQKGFPYKVEWPEVV